MQNSFLAFCHRQSAKIAEYAEDCTDPVLKDTLLRMSASWLSMPSAPKRDTEQPTIKAAS
jgi:hypothetical protein